MPLFPAATIVLTRAAEYSDRRLEFDRKLPTGGRRKMIDALLRDGLIAETLGDYRHGDGAILIEDAASGLMLTTLTLTEKPAWPQLATPGPTRLPGRTPPHRATHPDCRPA